MRRKQSKGDEIHGITEAAKPRYLIDEKGRKKADVLNIKEYEHIVQLIEDLEDANDLLRAEREAGSFIPYDKFRKKWLKECKIVMAFSTRSNKF